VLCVSGVDLLDQSQNPRAVGHYPSLLNPSDLDSAVNEGTVRDGGAEIGKRPSAREALCLSSGADRV
jgi:hypothetical protein